MQSEHPHHTRGHMGLEIADYVVQDLDPRERQSLVERLAADNPKTLDALGAEFGVSAAAQAPRTRASWPDAVAIVRRRLMRCHGPGLLVTLIPLPSRRDVVSLAGGTDSAARAPMFADVTEASGVHAIMTSYI